MDLNRKNTKRLVLLIAFGVVLYWVLTNPSQAWRFVSGFFSLFFPFLLGGCLAFLVNVVLRPVERGWRRLWGKRYGPRQDKARRPVCLLVSVLLVIGVVFALFFVIVPSLKDSIVNFVNLLPERILQLQNWWNQLSSFLAEHGAHLPDFSLNGQEMQQKIIDVLDQAEKVHITGKNNNKTDLYVSIWPLKDATKESAFENCVADVNIPVGEVFTSPVLKGTTGKLFVSQVYLNELKYLNLEIDFEDGMIRDYTCTNFEKEEECRKYIKENVLMNHETLPMGEFAIGTNTTAYRMARDFDIADKLPILIAEKTGPHFAVGDTCYSHEEDMVTYNPDGKQIVARENDFSKLRSEDMSKAYFNCHTDITIPYDELDKITVIRKDGTTEDIISDGRFVLAGIEELNKPLDR